MEVQVLQSHHPENHKSDRGKQLSFISVLEAMKMLVLSWSEVSENTFITCFLKAGFKEGMSVENDIYIYIYLNLKPQKFEMCLD